MYLASGAAAASSGEPDFHLHPHYRERRPLDAVLLKTIPGSDSFITEKYAAQISETLSAWIEGLLRSPAETKALSESLAPQFMGGSLRPVQSKSLRTEPALQVHRNTVSSDASLPPSAFLREWRSFLNGWEKVHTAEFQITEIDASQLTSPSKSLKTRVRYELAGSGKDFHREQRVGEWDLEWTMAAAGALSLRRFQAVAETQSRASTAFYADITAAALGSNSSYREQLQHGADYWRTVLDGASGIDVYGHNGVAVGDVDGDGFDDLYVCQAAGLPNRLYRNRGDGTFQDVTEAAGVGLLENTACALFADIDNDGRQDLIVVTTGGPLLFLNEGNGRFQQKRDAFHFANPPQGTFTGAAIADYDRDGWLDIYFCLYIYYQGTDQYKYPSPYYDAENGPPNFLMRNQRDGTFRDVTAETGLNQKNTRYSFCCGWNDYNQDGWPDLYVVNDFGRKNLYRNNGNGTFTDVAADDGAEDVGAGMSVSWLDYNNDGLDDLYVANMWTAAGLRVSTQDNFQKSAPEPVRALYRKHAMGNSLLRATTQGKFEEEISAGVAMGRWAWSSDAWDFDHDGFLDLYIANGMVSGPSREDLNSFFWRQVVANSPPNAKPAQDYEQGWNALNELLRSDGTWSGYERNVFYANNRDGTFSDVSGVVGLDFSDDGRAFALADFDHDGRLEVFLKNRNAPQLRVLKNVVPELPPSISFRLRGTKSTRDAIGAGIVLETSTGRQSRTLQAGSGFLSQHSKEMLFGLGEAKGNVHATIHWPSGLVQHLHDLPPNHRISVDEGNEVPRIEAFNPPVQVNPAEKPQPAEVLPDAVETWLLAPVAAPPFSLADLSGRTRSLSDFRGKALLLNFWVAGSDSCRRNLDALNGNYGRWATAGLQLLAVSLDESETDIQKFASVNRLSLSILRGSDDVAGVYNLLYRYLFDRHRDLSLPTSFLVNAAGEIVKVYQGTIEPEQVERDFQHIPHIASERMARALPFSGLITDTEFRRNYLSLGSVFFQRGYLEPAEAAFQQAFHDDPSSAEALYGLGSIYLKQHKTAEAQANFERITKMDATYPDTLPNAWNNLGLIATQQGRIADAIPYFLEALRLSPDHLVALENLGNAYRVQKRWDEARTTLERAAAVNPEDSEANYSLGMVFAQTGDTEQAHQYLERALQLKPDYPEALNNIGILYLRTERRDAAVASFEKCIQVAPDFDQAYLNLARVYAIEGTPEKARAVLLQLLQRHPGHPLAQQMLDALSR